MHDRLVRLEGVFVSLHRERGAIRNWNEAHKAEHEGIGTHRWKGGSQGHAEKAKCKPPAGKKNTS